MGIENTLLIKSGLAQLFKACNIKPESKSKGFTEKESQLYENDYIKMTGLCFNSKLIVNDLLFISIIL